MANDWWDVQAPPVLACPSDASLARTINVGGYSWIFGGADRPASLTSYVPSTRAFGKNMPGGGQSSVWNQAWDNCSGEKKMGDFPDGTSNTICEIEKPMITGDSIVTASGWGVQNSVGPYQDGANLWGKTDIDPAVLGMFGCNCNDPNVTWDDEYGQWWTGDCRFSYNGMVREYYQPPVRNRPPDQQSYWEIYPLHAGGISNALMVDGSVQSLSNNIDIFVWSALMTPLGREPATGL